MLLAFRRGWLPNQSRGYLRPLPQTGKPSCDGSTADFRVVDLISHHDVRILMLSNVLKSKRATQVNIEIMRAFVRLRQMLASNVEFSRRLDELDSKYDRQFKVVFDALRQIMNPTRAKQSRIGFRRSDEV